MVYRDQLMEHAPTGSSRPLVSIIIATYNAAELLPFCIASILALQSESIEIVVVDGASTDNTLAVARKSGYPHLKIISEPDNGIYDAYNKGARIASGKWLHFLGSDDLVLPGFSQMMQLLKQDNTIYYGDSEPYYLGDGKPDYILLGGRFSKYRLAKYPVNHQAVFYPSAVFDVFSYDVRYRIFADYAMNLKLWGHSSFRTQYHPLFVVKYNMNGFSSMVKDQVFKADKPRLIREHLGWWIYWKFRWKKYRKKMEGNKDW